MAPANRVRTDSFDAVTGWDWLFWHVARNYEIRRMARAVLRARCGGVFPDPTLIAQRFVAPDGRCFLITSQAGDVKLDDRPVRHPLGL